MIFNYKDWWGWIFWVNLLYCAFGILTVSDWTRWKWGYYSLDSIPYLIWLCLLGYFNFVIMFHRIYKRIDKLEGETK